MSSNTENDRSDRRLKKAIKIFVILNILFWIAVLFLQCGDCAGKPSTSSTEKMKKQLEYVQLLYNNKVHVECRVSGCEFTMKSGEFFKIIGAKFKGDKAIVPVGSKPKKSKKPLHIRLKGDDVDFDHKTIVTAGLIDKAKSEHFTFKTSYGDVPAIIWVKRTEVSDEPSEEDYDKIKADLCGYAGQRTHLLIDASGSMEPYIDYLWPIIEKVLKDCSIQLSGLSWYANRGQVWHSPHVSQQALSAAVKQGRASQRSDVMVYEAPSPALENVANIFRTSLIILLSDEGAAVGGLEPNTKGIPVYAIALSRSNRCDEDLGAIANHTRGKMKLIEPF